MKEERYGIDEKDVSLTKEDVKNLRIIYIVILGLFVAAALIMKSMEV